MDTDRRIAAVTRRLIERSKPTRQAYLARIGAAAAKGPRRAALSCGNLAHGFAACGAADKQKLSGAVVPNLGIVTAYNDMLSAHQPYERYPDIIREAAQAAGGVAQVAGGVPAMCDGVTQGQPGMELSLFSRDVIALGAAVALSHDMFDAAVYLGICDKIVPGLVMAALAHGHLPAVFVPAGPMPSGLPNAEKSRIRQLYAEGKASRQELLEAEAQSYHAPGTCTFYGTANSNQMLMEMMGLHLPGAAFVNPGTPLREALTREAARRALAITALGNEFTPAARIVDEKAIVNGVVGLHATGGSTNHTIHLVAMARAAGIALEWQDISDLSEAVPLIARVYPNGMADVNRFHAAGGMGFVVGQLLAHGLAHGDVTTVWGKGLLAYASEPFLGSAGGVEWRAAARESGDKTVLADIAKPFRANGGLKMLAGNLGQAVAKLSAVREELHALEAPAMVFDDQDEVIAAFRAGRLNRDVVVVLRFQGPRSNGMPELHKLTPALGVLLDRGYRVALVTDGRMSGASGKVPSAIHVTPEAARGGPIARIRDGDMVRLDAAAGTLDVLVAEAAFARRRPARRRKTAPTVPGHELFARFREAVTSASQGASVIA
jgi:phosphogluconate dehydratase